MPKTFFHNKNPLFPGDLTLYPSIISHLCYFVNLAPLRRTPAISSITIVKADATPPIILFTHIDSEASPFLIKVKSPVSGFIGGTTGTSPPPQPSPSAQGSIASYSFVNLNTAWLFFFTLFSLL